MSDLGKRDSLLEPTLLILLDMVLLEAAFLVTYWFRFHSGIWKVPLGIPPFEVYLLASFVILAVFFGIFYYLGMFGGRMRRGFEEDLVGLFKGVVLGSLLMLALAFFFRRMTFSRSFFGLFFLSSYLFLVLGRVAGRWLLRRVLAEGRATTRLLVVGNNAMRARLLRTARELPGLGLKPVGWVAVDADDAADPQDGDLPRLGELDRIEEIVRQHGIDLVTLTLPFERLALVSSIADRFADLDTHLEFVPDLQALRTSRMRVTEMAGIPFMSVREVGLGGVERIVKRTFDLVCSALGLVLFSPLFLLLAVLVKLSSPGAVLYRQARVGRDGSEFDMLKFRSMSADAEDGSGPVWTVENDRRVTGVGRFLRRFSLDELPQIWNVLTGDMSLVGPRPERRVFVERFRQEMPRYFERHRVRSGLTGWAQVNGLRGNTSVVQRTLYDLHYVENWSLALDIKILLMTVLHVLRGENAY